jgi:hypothetical protein
MLRLAITPGDVLDSEPSRAVVHPSLERNHRRSLDTAGGALAHYFIELT